MKVLSALLFVLGLVVVAFAAIIYFQFQQLATAANPQPNPLLENVMNVLTPDQVNQPVQKPAQLASQFINRLMMVGGVGVFFCLLAMLAFLSGRRNPQRD